MCPVNMGHHCPMKWRRSPNPLGDELPNIRLAPDMGLLAWKTHENGSEAQHITPNQQQEKDHGNREGPIYRGSIECEFKPTWIRLVYQFHESWAWQVPLKFQSSGPFRGVKIDQILIWIGNSSSQSHPSKYGSLAYDISGHEAHLSQEKWRTSTQAVADVATNWRCSNFSNHRDIMVSIQTIHFWVPPFMDTPIYSIFFVTTLMTSRDIFPWWLHSFFARKAGWL